MSDYSKQWNVIAEWRQWLDGKAAPPTRLDSQELAQLRQLDEIWQMAQAEFPCPAGLLAHDKALPPLGVLFEIIAQGFYPPPELMLGLAGSFDAYLKSAQPSAQSKISKNSENALEKAFFGPPVPKSGNFANRFRADFDRNGIIMETVIRKQLHGSTTVAAVNALNEHRKSLDPKFAPLDPAYVTKLIRDHPGNKKRKIKP